MSTRTNLLRRTKSISFFFMLYDVILCFMLCYEVLNDKTRKHSLTDF